MVLACVKKDVFYLEKQQPSALLRSFLRAKHEKIGERTKSKNLIFFNRVGHLSAPNIKKTLNAVKNSSYSKKCDFVISFGALRCPTRFHSLAGVISFRALKCPTLFHSLAGVIALLALACPTVFHSLAGVIPFGALRCPTMFQKMKFFDYVPLPRGSDFIQKNRIFLISFGALRCPTLLQKIGTTWGTLVPLMQSKKFKKRRTGVLHSVQSFLFHSIFLECNHSR